MFFHTLDFSLTPEEWKELENRVAAIPVVGDRYNAEQQKQVQSGQTHLNFAYTPKISIFGGKKR